MNRRNQSRPVFGREKRELKSRDSQPQEVQVIALPPTEPLATVKVAGVFKRWGKRIIVTMEVAALTFALFGIPMLIVELNDRHDDRITRAWQLVTTSAPGNSGKGPALEYLNSETWVPEPYRSFFSTFIKLKERIPLNGIDLSKTNHRGAVDISSANLEHANLEYSNLEYSDLSHSTLRQAMLSGAFLKGSDFSNADLSDTDLSGVNLSWAFLVSANVSDANLAGAVLSYAHLSKADLSGTNFINANLSNADLSGADLSNAKLFRTNLSNSSLSATNLSGANLWEADLSGASLFLSTLINTDLTDTDLTNADIRAADLTGADLRGAKLTGADLKGSKIGMAFLHGANFNEVICDDAYHWKEAEMPETFPCKPYMEVSDELSPEKTRVYLRRPEPKSTK